jgi:hypothetical protein
LCFDAIVVAQDAAATSFVGHDTKGPLVDVVLHMRIRRAQEVWKVVNWKNIADRLVEAKK